MTIYKQLNMPDRNLALLEEFRNRDDWSWDGLAMWLAENFTKGDLETLIERTCYHSSLNYVSLDDLNRDRLDLSKFGEKGDREKKDV